MSKPYTHHYSVGIGTPEGGSPKIDLRLNTESVLMSVAAARTLASQLLLLAEDLGGPVEDEDE